MQLDLSPLTPDQRDRIHAALKDYAAAVHNDADSETFADVEFEVASALAPLALHIHPAS